MIVLYYCCNLGRFSILRDFSLISTLFSIISYFCLTSTLVRYCYTILEYFCVSQFFTKFWSVFWIGIINSGKLTFFTMCWMKTESAWRESRMIFSLVAWLKKFALLKKISSSALSSEATGLCPILAKYAWLETVKGETMYWLTGMKTSPPFLPKKFSRSNRCKWNGWYFKWLDILIVFRIS